MGLTKEEKISVLKIIRSQLTTLILTSIENKQANKNEVEHFEDVVDGSSDLLEAYNDLKNFTVIAELNEKKESIQRLIVNYVMRVLEGLKIATPQTFPSIIERCVKQCGVGNAKKIFNALLLNEYPNLTLDELIPDSDNDSLGKTIHAMEVLMRLPANALNDFNGFSEAKQLIWKTVEQKLDTLKIPQQQDISEKKPSTAYSGTHFKAEARTDPNSNSPKTDTKATPNNQPQYSGTHFKPAPKSTDQKPDVFDEFFKWQKANSKFAPNYQPQYSGTHFKPASKSTDQKPDVFDEFFGMGEFINDAKKMPERAQRAVEVNKQSQNLLLNAIANQKPLPEIQTILQKYPNLILQTDNDLNNPLHLAVVTKRSDGEEPKLVHLLMDEGVDINGKNRYGMPPSHFAIAGGASEQTTMSILQKNPVLFSVKY